MRRRDFLKYTSFGVISPLAGIVHPFSNAAEVIKPKRIAPGDTIQLIAPAGIIYEEDEFYRMESILKEFELDVVFGKNVRKRHGYFSGTDQERADDFNHAFENSDVDAVMAVRGGWGTARLLDLIDFDMIKKNPKIYCGFSDNTTLHLAIQKHTGLVTFHGPNGNSDWTSRTKQSFRDVCMDGKLARYEFGNESETIFPGLAEGPLIGGNFTIFTTLLGTSFQPDTAGAILFLEDIGEPVYKIDRMFSQLKNAGLLSRISGLIFGKCTECKATGRESLELVDVLKHYTAPLQIPVQFGVDIGHEPDNLTIPVGISAKLDTSKNRLNLTETAVV